MIKIIRGEDYEVEDRVNEFINEHKGCQIIKTGVYTNKKDLRKSMDTFYLPHFYVIIEYFK